VAYFLDHLVFTDEVTVKLCADDVKIYSKCIGYET